LMPDEDKLRIAKSLEFPQIVIDKWVCLPKAPVRPIFEMIRMAVS